MAFDEAEAGRSIVQRTVAQIVQEGLAQMLLCFMIEKRLVSRLHSLADTRTEFADTNKDVAELAAKIQENFKELGV